MKFQDKQTSNEDDKKKIHDDDYTTTNEKIVEMLESPDV
jgi:hypothetical protein